MKVKNLTPFPFGPKLTARKPPQKEMAIVVRGAFWLRPGEPLVPFAKGPTQRPMTGETFLITDEDRRGEATYPGDFADFKLGAEVFLKGSCYTPAGAPLKECAVRFAVGTWSKSLRVVGDRSWSDGLLASISEPTPFTRMTLDHSRAFGGPGYANNPVGKGHGTRELPNVELPNQPTHSRSDRHDPGSFGPISSRWPQRSGKVGREYGASYKKTRAPFFAEDFDWSFFSAAPADQQLDGYLRGDEEVTFQNLHPTAQVFSVRLPALRIRVLTKRTNGEIREAPMVLDTLHAEPEDARLTLTWRGLTTVNEDDFTDVAILFIASEPLASEPLSMVHYQALIEAFEKDPLGVEEHLEKKVPAHLQDAARRVLKGEPPMGPPAPDGTPPAEAIGHVLRGTPGAGAKAAGEVEAAIGQAIAQAAPHTDLGAALTAGLARARSPGRGAAGSTPRVPLADALKQLTERFEAVKKAAAGSSQESHPGLARLESVLADPRLRNLDPQVAPPGEPDLPPPPEPGPGVDCSRRDLSGLDLSGRDLTGANFQGAILSKTNLSGAKLASANLREATLAGANLDGANLDGADLTRANLSAVHGHAASFKGVSFTGAVLQKADLTRAVLDGATAELMFFKEVDLTGARLRQVHFRKVMFVKGSLEGADLEGADFRECHVNKTRARNLIALNAFLPRTSFSKSDLTGACFDGARGDRTIWLEAKLEGASFRLSVLPWSHFSGATGAGTSFYGANLKGSRFYRAELEKADFERSNLHGADLCKATLLHARFNRASLYDAKLIGTVSTGADFSGANLKRALIDPS